eukprot:11054717-Lingulodinium_polyedra.AAC.1
MDMAAFALDSILLGKMAPKQLWASDAWEQTRAFMGANHSPEVIFDDVKAKPRPGPLLVFYVAGPPCQPWAKHGRALGAGDPRAALLDE